MNTYTYENNFGTGEFILTAAYALARKKKPFRFGNITRKKVKNMVKKYEYYIKIQDMNDERGFDTSKQREALAIVKRELDKISQ